MKVLKYLFRKGMLPLYCLAAAVISFVFSCSTGGGGSVFLRIFPMVLCILLLLRGRDDHADFEKDAGTKTQYLSKQGLLMLILLAAVCFISLNLMFYGAKGFFSLAAVGFFLLMQKLPLLKTFCLMLAFLYFFCLEGVNIGVMQIMVLLGCGAASVIFHMLKRRKRK